MRRGRGLALAILVAVLWTGCGQAEEVDRAVELQAETVSENSYELTPVTWGTVQQPLVLNCSYSQTLEMDLYFAVDQELITNVYVEKGDLVEKGELLASVDVENMEKQVREMEHQLARTSLKLQQIQENREFDLEQAEILYSYTPMSEKDKDGLEEQKENIVKSYQNSLEDASDSVEMLSIRLEEAREYLKMAICMLLWTV